MPSIIRIKNLEIEENLTGVESIPIDRDDYGSNAKRISLAHFNDYITGTTQRLFSGITNYVNPEATPEDVGGIEAGSTFPAPGYTMQEMFDWLLYPYQYPTFTSFSISISTPQEIGINNLYDATFTWSTSNSSSVSGNSISIGGSDMTTLTNLANDFSEYYDFGTYITRTTPGSKTWTINGKNTQGGSMSSRSDSVRFDWRWYWGTSSLTGLTETNIESLSNDNLYSSYSRTYTFTGDGYKYLCWADTYGGPSLIIDQLTGFEVAMEGGVAPYTNKVSGTYYYALVSVTNAYSQTTNYRVYRSKNSFGSINITVS